MDIGTVVFSVIGALLGLFGLSFTVFWAIISRVENRLSQKITDFGTQLLACQAIKGKAISNIYTDLNKKSEIGAVESTYVRKKEHDLEFQLLKDKLDNLQMSIKEVKLSVDHGNSINSGINEIIKMFKEREELRRE